VVRLVAPPAAPQPERVLVQAPLRVQPVQQPLVSPSSRPSWPWLWWVLVLLPWKVVVIR
jgi:hypothetical protein